MSSAYYRDLESISLASFRHSLETGRLLPSEGVLREELAERFAVLRSLGIENLHDLSEALRTKKRLQQFAQQSGLPAEYLTVLRRRAGTYTPRPVPLAKMPGVADGHIEKLAALGIKDSRQLWERATQRPARAELSQQAAVPEEVLLELLKLSDLVRAPWVGPAFARLLYESGLDTIAKLSAQAPEALREQLVATNRRANVYKAPIPGNEDMASWLEMVRQLPKVLEE